MISVKYDIATRHNRSFLGINVQFIKDGFIELRTLEVKELMSRHTSTYLQQIVLDILQNYNIGIEKLYCCTSDNGRNIIKTSKMLQEEQELIIKQKENEDQENVEEEINSNEHDDIGILTVVNCAVHTLQLAVTDVLHNASIRETIGKVCKINLNISE